MLHAVNKHLNLISLCLIILLGFFLRIYQLNLMPSGFFADEASIGFNAHTIFTKGTDEYDIKYPLFFRAFGEFKSPIEIYSTVPSVAIFGLNEFSIRLPSAVFGTTTIIAIYLFTKTLLSNYKNKKTIALISALFLAISPWHIHFSRAPMEGFMPYVLFTITGLYFFLKSQHNIRLIYLSVFSFTLATYSYFPARIFIPLFGLGIFCVYYNFFWQHKKETILSFILAFLLLMPLVNHSLSPSGLSRWQQVNIFSQPPKDETVIQHIINNYKSHFSLDFLFLKGDVGMPGQFITRHSVRGMGELYTFQLPLIILGFIFLAKKTRKTIIILLLWLALYPTGSMFTLDKSAQATRSIIGVIPYQILSAIGLYFIFTLFSKFRNIFNYLPKLIILSVIFISLLNYLNLYFIKYPQYSSDFWGWQFGARNIVKYFVSQESKYDELVMAPEFNAPDIFFKFYSPNNCTKCRVGLPENSYNPYIKQLFAVTSTYLQDNPMFKFKIIKTVYYPNNAIAFLMGEIVQ